MKKIRLITLLASLFLLSGCLSQNSGSKDPGDGGDSGEVITTYIVTFDSDGGSAVATQTVKKGEKATKPTNPTKSGYTFSGWFKGETEFDFNTPINENITLRAKWTESATSYSVSLNKHQLEIMMEHHEKLIATITPTPKTGYRNASFKSDNLEIATVNADGEVFPTGLGECNITASYEDGSDTCHVVVKPWVDGDIIHVASVDFDLDSLLLDSIGSSKKLTVQITPENATEREFTWESSNEDIASVTSDGTVTAHSNGSAIITVTSKDQTAKSDSITVVVRENGEEYGYNYYNNYYGELTWSNSEDLKSKLYTIIHNGYTALPYGGSPANWETNQFADQDLYQHDMVDLVYSDQPLPKTLTNKSGNGGWQREHAFAASLMTGQQTGEASKVEGRATDFHNLFASDQKGNTSRGNKNLGYANPDSANYTKTDNYCYDNNFEPSDNDKGRMARAIFYMGVMYSKSENENYQPLTIQEEYVEYSAGNCQYAIGNLSSLIKWNSFPVDYLEYQHNESVYSHILSSKNKAQGNRNPFVDYPDLVEYVYGALKDQPGDLKYLKPTYDYLSIGDASALHYAVKDVETNFMVGDTFDSSSYVLLEVDHSLKEKTVDKSNYLAEPYTFIESDIGTKQLTIKTPINEITIKVNVEEKSDKIPINECKYYSGDPLTKNDYVSQLANAKLSLKLEVEKAISQYSTNGISIPVEAKNVTLTSESLNNIDEIAFKMNTNKDVKFHVTIKIDSSTVYNQDLTGIGRGSDPNTEFVKLEAPMSGVITIVISDFSKPLYIAAIGINAD